MTKDEAFLEWYNNAHWGNEDLKECCHRSWNAAIEKARSAPVQEPVAVKHMMGWVESLKRQSDYGKHMRIPGINAGACFELAIELEQFIRTTPPAAQRQWVGLIRGVRVEGDSVVITVKGGNDAARELCAALIQEMNT